MSNLMNKSLSLTISRSLSLSLSLSLSSILFSQIFYPNFNYNRSQTRKWIEYTGIEILKLNIDFLKYSLVTVAQQTHKEW
jgi:hypothetical protein